MYLFKSDAARAGGIIDYQTRNHSFLRMSVLLRKMGVKNNNFMLHLIQPELQGVDPFDIEHLTSELTQRIALECKLNPWYYFRECIRIASQGGDPIPFQLSRANLAIIWCFFNNTDSYVVIPRQNGKSIAAMSVCSWQYDIGARNAKIGIMCKDGSLVQENVSRLKDILRGLPPYLYKKSVQDTDNKLGISYTALNNSVVTWPAASDPIAATKIARGHSLISEFWDEVAYFRYIETSYQAATSATSAAAPNARKNGIPTANVLCTTAGYISNPDGAYAYALKNNCLRFTELLYDYESSEAFADFVRSYPGRMCYIEYDYKQLGHDDEWLAENTRNKSALTIATDYLNQWQLGSGASVVDKRLLQLIDKSIVEPTSLSIEKKVLIRWYVDKDKLFSDPELTRLPFIFGIDVSDNVGRDATTFYMSDPRDLSTIATINVNEQNPVDVVKAVYEIMKKLPNSIAVIERNRSGALFIDILIDFMLRDGINPLFRLFNMHFHQYDGKLDTSNLNYDSGEVRRKFGFVTSPEARRHLYSTVLTTMLEYMANRLKDITLADQIKSLTVRNGRVDHPEGQHDDLVIALMLVGYFVFFSRNHSLYGINQSDMLTAVDVNGNRVDPESKKKIEQARDRIRELDTLIQNATDTRIRFAYERERRSLAAVAGNITIPQIPNYADAVRKQDEPVKRRFDPMAIATINRYFM